MGAFRRGARETKNASMKTCKNNPVAAAGRTKTAAKDPRSGPAVSLPPPQLGSEAFFDAGVALLSRQFDRDRDRVIARARQEDCCGMLVWFADFEKQTALADYCSTFSGLCYFSVGIHPDNIDRTNKKSHDDWLDKVEELAKRAECLSILSGLNLSRDIGTHFAQEYLLKASCALAAKLDLPIVLHISDAVSLLRAIEILRAEHLLGGGDEGEEGEDDEEPALRVLLHDAMTCCESNVEHINAAAQAGCYFLLAATGLTDSSEEFAEAQRSAQACVVQIPAERLLLCTDSPWKTPQNLPDAYLRTMRNEPSNIASIAVSVSETLTMDIKELTALIRSNTVEVFGLNAEAAPSLSGATPTVTFAAEPIVGPPSFSPTVSAKRPSKPAPAPPPAKVSSSRAYYSCTRCRCRLFSGTDRKTHPTSDTVFKVGTEGLCAAALMFKAESDNIEQAGAVTIKGGNVECGECGSKVGKFHTDGTVCECGATVEGPVIKVAASKVDHCDGATQDSLQDLRDLARRAEAESAELQRQDAVRAEETSLHQGGSKKEKKKKQPKAENKGNFTSFRNKSFIPGASKASGSVAEDSTAGAEGGSSSKSGASNSKGGKSAGAKGGSASAESEGGGRRGAAGRREKNSLELLERMVGKASSESDDSDDN